jgi:ubiquinone/menaquinone biosynthesis C-methylase UbiE
MVALDFGCGPGRNIIKYWDRFKRIDGVDIMPENLKNAKRWVEHNGKDGNSINLYECNGYDLSNIPDQQYDMVFSTICMQHICSYDIRLNYIKEFNRVLKSGGIVSIQMGYGRKPGSKCVDYYENKFDASQTNGDGDGAGDVTIEDPLQIYTDLTENGFTDFLHVILPPFLGDRDYHQNFIIFRATKI